jgi:hypothetical protein
MPGGAGGFLGAGADASAQAEAEAEDHPKEPVEFTSTPVTTDRGHVRLPLPFDPRDRWGKRPRHYVEGTVAGTPFSGSVGFAAARPSSC